MLIRKIKKRDCEAIKLNSSLGEAASVHPGFAGIERPLSLRALNLLLRVCPTDSLTGFEL